MFYLRGAGLAEHYRNNIKAISSVLYTMGCEKIAGGPGEFSFFRLGDNRLGRCEVFIGPGFYLNKDDRAIGGGHNKVYFAGLTGEIAGEFAESLSFEELLASFFTPSSEQFSVGQ